MDAIGVGGRIGLLFRGEHFALADGMNGGVCIFSVLGEFGDVKEMNWLFHGPCYV